MREWMQWDFCCLVKPECLLQTKKILQSIGFTKEYGTLHFFFFLLVVILQHDEYLQQYVKKDTVKSLGITA